jgi:mannose-6-phosphate isomerase-like protein (cupin superfamily)
VSIVESRDYRPLDEGDPDDYRPNSQLAFVIDTPDADGRVVRSLALIFERCAPGDRIPLHTHSTDEVVIVDSGEIESTLGAESRLVPVGAVVFVPAGTAHAWTNKGADYAHFHAIFPTDVLDITYLERNAAPGTEGDAPKANVIFDLRSLTA